MGDVWSASDWRGAAPGEDDGEVAEDEEVGVLLRPEDVGPQLVVERRRRDRCAGGRAVGRLTW